MTFLSSGPFPMSRSSTPLRPVHFLGIGTAIGPRILTNPEISRLTGFKESAIFSLTGIRTRSFSPFEDEIDLAVRAAEDLFSKMGKRKTPDLLLAATTTPSGPIPSTAMKIHGRLFPGGSRVFPAGMDIGGSCAAFLSGLFVARAQIASGMADSVLLINTERKTRHVCPQHSPDAALLFGDGATAAWLSATPFPVDGSRMKPLHLRAVRIGADGQSAGVITYARDPEGGHRILRMNGRALFRKAVRTLSREIERILEEQSLNADQIGAFILHQANGRILDGVARALGIPKERLPRTIDLHGNTSSASLGITLDHFLSRGGPEDSNAPLLLAAIGGGLTYGVALLDYS